MTRWALLMVLAATNALGGCRSCNEDKGTREAVPSGPTMPKGMLVPSDAVAPASTTASLRIARNVKGGPWTELQVARPGDRADRKDFQHWRDESSFVSLEAMTLLHEPFARALPGFDLFLPRLYPPDSLTKLAAELDDFGKRADGPIAETARELATQARETAANGASLWVLGP